MTERQYPWDELEIDVTDDKKLIKKAYAVLLKQFKPDENPEKFKEIQAAYKSALAMLQWQVQEKFDKPVQETGKNNQPQSDDFILETAVGLDEESLVEEKQQTELIENLYKQLHEMAFAPLAVKDKLENWKFIEDYYQIDDLLLKEEVARTVFKKVAEYNLFQLKQNKTMLIEPAILKYMDEIFDWSSKWNDYQNLFPEHYFKVTLDALQNRSVKLTWFNGVFLLFFRGIGLVVDLFISGIVTFLLVEILLSDLNNPSIIVVLCFILYTLISELLSKYHITIGMKYAKVLLLDEFGNTCSKKSILQRQLFFHLSLSPFYLWMTGFVNSDLIFSIMIAAVFVINVISFTFFRRLIHDVVSKTVVISF